MGETVRSTKWYGRFWPPERRKIKLMQAIYDHMEPEIEKKWQKAWSDNIIYGKPLPTPNKDNNLIDGGEK
jgi:hypothetical protein